jgi:hypothetical protein
MGEMIKITGLWKNVSEKGEAFMSGSLGGAKVLIFKNSFKQEEKHPDYNMFFAAKEKKEAPEATVDDDEIPF